MILLGRIRLLGLVGALVAVLAIGGAVPAAADYGNSNGNVQLYQVTASMNCNNPSICGNNLGGFWAWAVFNQDSTFDGEVTGCGHLANAHGPGLQGAQHMHVEGHYIITDFGARSLARRCGRGGHSSRRVSRDRNGRHGAERVPADRAGCQDQALGRGLLRLLGPRRQLQCDRDADAYLNRPAPARR